MPKQKPIVVAPAAAPILVPKSPVIDTCLSCAFSDPTNKRIGFIPHTTRTTPATLYPCRRFPVVTMKEPTDWCGEFKAKEG